ncbi:MAG: SH3 domain-containing protein [Devosia sp.]
MPSFAGRFGQFALLVSLAVLPSIAEAAPGRALSVANVRSGPGLKYPVVATLADDQYVVVTRCLANWCEVRRIGKNGWVSRKLLYNPDSDSSWRGYEFAFKGGPEPGRSNTR